MDSNTATEPKATTGRRAKMRTIYVYNQVTIPQIVDEKNPVFAMQDGKKYGFHESGAVVRLDKDLRSPKERKRARREARAALEVSR